MNLKKTNLIGLLGTSLIFSACHKNPVTPQIEDPPTIESISANPSSVYTNTPTLFTIQTKAPDGLDSLVMDFGDGTHKTVQEQQKTNSTDTVSVGILLPGHPS